MATKNWLADRDLYLNAAKTEAVEADDPAAAFLLARKGRIVKGALVVKYKLKDKAKAKPKSEPKAKPKTVKKSVREADTALSGSKKASKTKEIHHVTGPTHHA